MRSSVIAMMLALVKCQSICQIDKIVDYTDSECKDQHEFHNKTAMESILDRSNQLLNDGGTCQLFSPQLENHTEKYKFTCLNSETIKVEPTNFKGEDPECKHPYPVEAAFPSYVAKSGDCVKTSYMSYTKFYISSTTGKFEEDPTQTWELNSHNKVKETNTKEAEQDSSAQANSCMIADFVRYDDPECKKESGDDKINNAMKGYYLYLQNTAINSPDCMTPKNNEEWGIKARAYCPNPSTVTIKFYNIMFEDPHCMRSYPESAQFDNSLTASDGQCVRSDDGYFKFTILPNDGRAWEYSPEWDDLKFKQEVAEDDRYAKLQRLGRLTPNNFKIEGDGYYVEVKSDMSDGYYQETTVKFDQYFMYSMDYMGQDGYGMPPCGPDAEYDMCKEKVFSQETCCTHITGVDKMFIESSEKSVSSFYRCMNQKVVDASFSFEIDGMKMSMSCTGDNKGSGASYITGSAILSSIVAMVTLASF